MAYLRPVVQLRNCGTTSRTSSNLNTPKAASSDFSKINTDSFLDLIWKSVSFASAVLRPLASYSFKTETLDKSNEEKGSRSSVLPPETQVSSTDCVNTEESIDHDKQAKLITEKISTNKSANYLEEAFWEWIGGGKLQEQKKKFLDRENKIEKITKPSISKTSLQQRSRFLVRSLNSASSSTSQFVRLEEICKHLLTYPSEKGPMVKDGLLRNVLWLRQKTNDEGMLMQIRITLSLLGYHNPPAANGIRILSIDGGGTRNMTAIEILRQLEARTNMKIYELFDYVCGVSSGAILAFLLGGLRMSPDECEALYYKLSMEVFRPSPLMGTSRLMWSHAYYDTTMWLNMLKNVFEEKLLVETTKNKFAPKLSAVSAIMNLPTLRAFIFRNYDYPVHSQSQYLGSCGYKMWEAIRASGAAPGYFQELPLGEYLHQDGGVMINNPAALGIHEARLLWPSEYVQCVISLGSGRFIPMTNASSTSNATYTSIKTKILKVIDSATDTEGVHIALSDLLSSNTYYRFNPYLTEFLSLDENRPEKLEQLKNDAQMYLRRNEYKFNQAITSLTKPRSAVKTVNDWLELKRKLFL